MIFYPIQNYCRSFRLSNDTLLEEIKPKVIEKYEDRQKSIKKLSILGSGHILMQKPAHSNLNRTLFSKCK